MLRIRSMRNLASLAKPIYHRIRPGGNRTSFLNRIPGNSFNLYTQKHTNLSSLPNPDVHKPQDFDHDSSLSYTEVSGTLDHESCSKSKAHNNKPENGLESISPPVAYDRKTIKRSNVKKSEKTKAAHTPKKRGPKPKAQKLIESVPPQEEILEKTVDAPQHKKRGRKPKKQESKDSKSLQESPSNKVANLKPKKKKKQETTNADESNSNAEKKNLISESLKLGIDTSSLSKRSTTNRNKDTKDELIKYIKTVHQKKDESLLSENQNFDNKNRVDIVDSQLCDDALERLRPSLEKYKGCDIIDLNPGVGLWSSKLHKELQPRSHILMEPHPSTYEPIIDSLLGSQDSKYRLVAENGMNWSRLEKVLSEEYLPHQPKLDINDPRLEQANNTLLVTANLACNHPRRFLGFRSLGAVVIYQFLSAIRTHALFQKYGKVRMLLWINPYDSKILPKNVATRKKLSLDAAVSCGHIELIVDADETDHKRREKRLDINRVKSVTEKMKKNGMRVPDGRETKILKAMRAGETGSEVAELSPKSLQKELKVLKDAYKEGSFKTESLDENDCCESTGSGIQEKTPEYKRMRELNRRYRRRILKSQKFSELADDFHDIQALYRKSCLITDATELSAVKEQIKTKSAEFKEITSSLSPNDSAELQYMCDNRRAYFQEPPCLLWDRREAEPLKCHENEFYPKNPLNLMDLRPALMPSASQDPGYHDTLSFITMQMCLAPSQSLREALENLAPGAQDWLLAECPSLTDPLKNGCPDLDLFSVRCVTSEMLIEMCEAWLRWPFRLHRNEVLHRLGSEAYYDQSE